MSDQAPLEKLYLRIDLDLLLEEVLGDRHFCAISERLAVGIYKLTNNHPDRGCYVQFRDEFSPDLKYPILWRYHAWAFDRERRARARARAQKEQDERWVLEANIANGTRALLKKWKISSSQAQMICTKLMREGNHDALLSFGVKKIITDVKEI